MFLFKNIFLIILHNNKKFLIWNYSVLIYFHCNSHKNEQLAFFNLMGVNLIKSWVKTFFVKEKNLTPLVQCTYSHYFGIKEAKQIMSWAPHICFNSCSVILPKLLKNIKQSIIFGVTMVWRESINYTNDFYFCLTTP